MTIFSIANIHIRRAFLCSFNRLILLLIFFFLGQAALVAQPLSLDEQAKLALDYIRNSQLDEAKWLLKDLPEQATKNEEILFARALLLTKLGSMDEAIGAWNRLIDFYPELAEPYNNLAVLLAAQAKLEPAVEALKRAIAANPNYARAHENLGDTYLALSLAYFNKANEIAPYNALAHKLERITSIQQSFLPDTFHRLPSNTTPFDEAATDKVERKLTLAEAEPFSTKKPTVDAKKEFASEQDIKLALNQWLDAWRRRDLQRYVSAYVPGYYPTYLSSHAKWVSQRQALFESNHYYDIDIDDLQIIFLDEYSAYVSFVQRLSLAGILQSDVIKIIDFVFVNGRWLLKSERVRAKSFS